MKTHIIDSYYVGINAIRKAIQIAFDSHHTSKFQVRDNIAYLWNGWFLISIPLNQQLDDGRYDFYIEDHAIMLVYLDENAVFEGVDYIINKKFEYNATPINSEYSEFELYANCKVILRRDIVAIMLEHNVTEFSHNGPKEMYRIRFHSMNIYSISVRRDLDAVISYKNYIENEPESS